MWRLFISRANTTALNSSCNSRRGSVLAASACRTFERSRDHTYVSESQNIWNFLNCVWLESSLKIVGRLLLVTVSAGAEGPWPDLLNAWVFQFPLLFQDPHRNCSVLWITKVLSRETFQWQRFFNKSLKMLFKICLEDMKLYVEMYAMGHCSKTDCNRGCWTVSPSQQISCIIFSYFFSTLSTVNLYYCIERLVK